MKRYLLAFFCSLFVSQGFRAVLLTDSKGPRPRVLLETIDDDMNKVNQFFDSFKFKVEGLTRKAQDAKQNLLSSLNQMMLSVKQIK